MDPSEGNSEGSESVVVADVNSKDEYKGNWRFHIVLELTLLKYKTTYKVN